MGADVDCLRMGGLVEWMVCRQASDTETSSLLPSQRLLSLHLGQRMWWKPLLIYALGIKSFSRCGVP